MWLSLAWTTRLWAAGVWVLAVACVISAEEDRALTFGRVLEPEWKPPIVSSCKCGQGGAKYEPSEITQLSDAIFKATSELRGVKLKLVREKEYHELRVKLAKKATKALRKAKKVAKAHRGGRKHDEFYYAHQFCMLVVRAEQEPKLKVEVSRACMAEHVIPLLQLNESERALGTDTEKCECGPSALISWPHLPSREVSASVDSGPTFPAPGAPLLLSRRHRSAADAVAGSSAATNAAVGATVVASAYADSDAAAGDGGDAVEKMRSRLKELQEEIKRLKKEYLEEPEKWEKDRKPLNEKEAKLSHATVEVFKKNEAEREDVEIKAKEEKVRHLCELFNSGAGLDEILDACNP